jgi:hypothetical protein
VDECRAAVLLAAEREDRADSVLLQRLCQAVGRAAPERPDPELLFVPQGPHHIPDRYAPADLLASAR